MKNLTKEKFIAILVAVFLVGGAVTAGGCLAVCKGALGYVSVSKSEYDEMKDTYNRFAKLEQLYETIDGSYYKDVDEIELVDGACKGLVEGLGDPYSSYMTEDEYENWKSSATGEYSGIGVTFSQDKNGNYVVVGVTKDSPAEKAGLKSGDYITKVDGKTYDDMDVMAKAIRGEAGTKVKLNYVRDGEEKEISITRGKIVEKSVEYKMLDGNIGYIKLSSFISSSADDFSEALKALEDKGAKGLILDLRDNGGGLVEQCIDIADEFLDEGVVTYVEDKNGKKQEYKAKDGKTELTTVVLVNGNSASCSEILAGALKDNGCKLVGETTFGKGVIQSTAELDDGSALKLTIMQYFSPKGNAIQDKGITPDYEVKNSENSSTDKQLEKALGLF